MGLLPYYLQERSGNDFFTMWNLMLTRTLRPKNKSHNRPLLFARESAFPKVMYIYKTRTETSESVLDI
jgi:hypothetical protein